MKQILVMMMVVLVGCGKDTPEAAEAESQANQKLIVEKAIRDSLKKPEGELTEAELGKITMLNLIKTRITDEGLKEVAKLQKLKKLYLTFTQITDEGLNDVTKLQKLTHLDLRDTQITDEGLQEVAKLQNLQVLYLASTQVTKAGVAELKKALPNCEISGP